jgi:hypothetical protein
MPDELQTEPDADRDFWSGKARGGSVGQDADVPRKPYRSSRIARLKARLPTLPDRPVLPALPGMRPPTGKARPIAAAVLLAGLTLAWLFVGHQSHGSAALTATTATPVPAPVPASTVGSTRASTASPIADALAAVALRTDKCEGLSTKRPHLLCVVDGAIMEVALYTKGTVGAVFRRIAGAPVPARSGPAACAADKPDERAWSSASAPQNAIGRYVCRIEGSRAAIWWTRGDRLLHVEAGDPHDPDLAKLFSWWLAHPSA